MHQDILDYLIRHICWYGNTLLGHMSERTVKEYIEELNKRGLDVTYRIIDNERNDRNQIVPQYYIIERRKNEQDRGV